VFDVTNPQYEGIITDTDVSSLSGERSDYEGIYKTTDDSAQYGFMTVNSGSDMGGIVFNIDAQLGASLTGDYESDVFIQVGMDKDSISVAGFGVFGSGSHSIRTYIDVFGNTIKERVKIFNVKESKVVNGQSIYFDLPSAGVYTLTLIDKENGQVVSRERFNGQAGENIKNIYTNSIQSQYLYLLLEDVTKKEISKTTIIIK
jgi:hypothetical protein